jgi:hypothetical protein
MVLFYLYKKNAFVDLKLHIPKLIKINTVRLNSNVLTIHIINNLIFYVPYLYDRKHVKNNKILYH